jgi:uncharacterized protein (TIGR02118 family)
MLRRLSILVRKPSQDRTQFAHAWEHHGTIVRHLPGIRSYQQNHVVEDVGHVGSPPAFRIDGIVELRFDSQDAMRAAFASDAAAPVKADEPNFLGHGTGYVAAEAHVARPSETGTKLVIAGRNDGDTAAGLALERAAVGAPGVVHVIRDDVVSVIARPELAEGPQPADFFLHLYFDSVEATRRAVPHLLSARTGHGSFSVVRVRTVTVV